MITFYKINDRCCRPGWAGLGKSTQKNSKRHFFGDMDGKDVMTNNEVHGEEVVGMDNQGEIMKYRRSRAGRCGGESRGDLSVYH